MAPVLKAERDQDDVENYGELPNEFTWTVVASEVGRADENLSSCDADLRGGVATVGRFRSGVAELIPLSSRVHGASRIQKPQTCSEIERSSLVACPTIPDFAGKLAFLDCLCAGACL